MLEALLVIASVIALPHLRGVVPDIAIFALMTGIVLLCLPGMLLMMRGNPPFVPTSNRTRRAMINLAAIRPGELVFDLGCGDGRILAVAAKRGARTVGYEFSLPTFLVAKLRSLFHRNMHIELGNFWEHQYGEADIIFCYLLRGTMQEFQQRIWPTLKDGARVVSNSFTMADVEYAAERDGAYLYIKNSSVPRAS